MSMGVFSDGSYGAPKGVIYSFPCTCKDVSNDLSWLISHGRSLYGCCCVRRGCLLLQMRKWCTFVCSQSRPPPSLFVSCRASGPSCRAWPSTSAAQCLVADPFLFSPSLQGKWSIVQGLAIDERSAKLMKITGDELVEEKALVGG